ncbi:related to epoxide hydrolase [Phialocephala subalpina]|uniref:Related to epoxide hydrolase n=1 Tax=Phialocephala subalpina TaxID=576137 RepID=A0A1L7WKX9_9HELO|nr:related to epoxide hydrolase [Phialocephala subalpina]
MSQEDFPVEFVLESIESIMPPSNQPKVLLFDIGGVCMAVTNSVFFGDKRACHCTFQVSPKISLQKSLQYPPLKVVSPFQAILDHEIAHGIPPGWINHSISRTSPNGFWHRLERGEIPIDASFFRGFTSDLHNSSLWSTFYTTSRQNDPSLPKEIPPLPKIDGEEVFWKMMSKSRDFDPWMYPALQKLKESGRFILSALSNTVIFPTNHPYANPPSEKDIRRIFDVFVSSAHVGLRKPSPEIYALALEMVNEYAKANRDTEQGKRLGWKEGVRAEEVVFLDDIGENLKAGKKAGFRTIRVHLGRAFEAVDELEDVTGMQLAGEHPRIAVKPVVRKKEEVAKL